MVMVEKLTMMVYPEMYKLLLCPRHWMQFWLGLLWLPGRSNHTNCTCFSVSLFVTISICLTFCLSLFPSLYLPIELTEFWDVLASLEEPPVTHWLIFKTLDLSQSYPNGSQICLNVSPICPNWSPNCQNGSQKVADIYFLERIFVLIFRPLFIRSAGSVNADFDWQDQLVQILPLYPTSKIFAQIKYI